MVDFRIPDHNCVCHSMYINAYIFIYVEPALVKCTEEVAAALATFDEYSSMLQDSINPFVFVPKCVCYELLRGDVTASVSGGTVFSSNQKKMEVILHELRSIIFEQGIEVFKKILYVLRTEPIYVKVADHIESKYCTLYI